MAMGTLSSAMPEPTHTIQATNAWESWRSTWEEPLAPVTDYEVGSPALPGRMLDDSSQETCPRDTHTTPNAVC
ncbi:hypothetical protein ColTof4_10818 [Colletotrichum tofieldiae]|nr:hypothetical protein ColTof3_06935 [Colletotrichum tofieldiae]GKT78395.1 hypothetical protein ColTof4_10818 [Colletotrichum tofieldiae]